MGSRAPILGRYAYKLWLPCLCAALPLAAAEAVCRLTGCAPPPVEMVPVVGRKTTSPDVSRDLLVRGLDNDVAYPFMVADDHTLWALRPGFADAQYTINSHATRGPEFPCEKPRSVVRVVCLGDSTTFGLGVMPEESYPRRLAERLGGGNSLRRFEVINGGVTGFSSAQCVAHYRWHTALWHPDIVTLCVGPNDLRTTPHLTDRELLDWRGRRSYRAWAALAGGAEWFNSYRTVRDIVARLAPSQSAQDASRCRVSPAEYRQNIVQLERLCAANGAQLVLIAFPWNPQNPSDETVAYRAAAETAAAEAQIPLLCLEELSEWAAADGKLFLDTVHPNAEGHALLAERLDPVIRTLAASLP